MRTRSFALALLACLTAHAVCINGHPSIPSEYRSAKAVVLVTVIGRKSVPATQNFFEGTMYRVTVEKLFRGKVPPKTLIFSENSTGKFPMEKGHKYLLFLSTENGRLVVDNCGNSALLSNNDELVQQVTLLSQASN
jgi:hypothetical protein